MNQSQNQTKQHRIASAKFLRGAAGTDELLGDGTPQVAFIGRSNVGKSSLINSLTGEEGLARTSSFPGLTQEINIYLINKSLYLLDLPGYGYAKASRDTREKIQKLIYWYLWDSPYVQKKVVLIIDANIGATKNDIEMLKSLDERGKDVIVVANKIDKIKKSEYEKKMKELQAACGNHKIIPYSSFDTSGENLGAAELTKEILA